MDVMKCTHAWDDKLVKVTSALFIPAQSMNRENIHDAIPYSKSGVVIVSPFSYIAVFNPQYTYMLVLYFTHSAVVAHNVPYINCILHIYITSVHGTVTIQLLVLKCASCCCVHVCEMCL